MSRERPWWTRPVRVLQFNIEDRHGINVSKLSGREIVEFAERLGANVLVIFARDPWGRVFYRGSKIGPVYEKMKGDIVREAVEEGRRRGIKIVVMVGHTANKYIYSIHSDWAQVNRDGEVIFLEHVPWKLHGYSPEWPQICINSPFIEEVVMKEIEEVAALGVDGIFLDSFRYQPDIEKACYCKWCERRFQEEHGYPMPREPKWGDSRWRELWEWRYKVVVEKLRLLSEHTKRVAPGRLFMYNSHPGGWAGRTNKVVMMARDSLDVVFAECSEVDHQPPGFITEMVKLTRSMLGDKPVWASRNYFHLYRTVASTTPLAIRQGVREAFVAGGSPWVLMFSNSYFQDRGAAEAIREAFEEHKRIEEYLDGAKPYYSVGVVVSNTTRDHYGKDHPEYYIDEIRGFYYAFTHSHIPVTYISDIDLEDPEYLSRFRVVVLANTACMSNEAVEAIRKYVSRGGRVIATYMASRRGEQCIKSYDLELKDVFGVEMNGLLRRPWSYVVIDEPEHPVFMDINKRILLWGDMSYLFITHRSAPMLGRHTLVVPTTGEPLAHIALALNSFGYEYTLGRSPPAMVTDTSSPAIIYNKYGEGASIYYTGQLGRHYWRTGLPEYGLLIRNSALFLMDNKPDFIVEAPETVAFEAHIQGNRLNLHLLNHTYNQRILATRIGKIKQAVSPYGSAEATHPPREVIPVHNIVIKINKRLAPGNRRAYSPLTGKDYYIVEKEDYLEITVPMLKEYELIVLE